MRRQAGEYLPGLGFAEVYFQFQDAVGVGVFFRPQHRAYPQVQSLKPAEFHQLFSRPVRSGRHSGRSFFVGRLFSLLHGFGCTFFVGRRLRVLFDLDARKEVGGRRQGCARREPVKSVHLVFQPGHGRRFGRHRLPQLLQHAGRSRGHDRPEAEGRLAHGRKQHIHHRTEPLHITLLVQSPGGLNIYIFVQGAHQFPQGFQPLRKLHVAEKLRKIPHGRGAELHNGQIRLLKSRGAGHDAAKIFAAHGQHPAEEVAQVVGQVCIDTACKGLIAEAGVGTEVHFTQQKVAESVCAEACAHGLRLHHIAQGF